MGSLLACVVFSDLFTIACIMTFDLPYLWNDDFVWVLGSFGCRSAGFLQTFAILFNSSTLIAISVDRYRCVVQARSQPFMPEWRSAHTAIYVLGVSALCLGTSMPYVFYFNLEGPFVTILIEEDGHAEMKCPVYFCWASASPTLQMYQGILTCLIFVPLLVAFLVCYSRLIVFLRHRPAVGAADSRQSRRKRKVILTVGAIMLTFFVCRLPPWIFLLVPQVNDRLNEQGRRTYSYIHYSLHMLSMCAPAINPFLYALLHQTYQQHLPANLRCAFWIKSASKRAKPVAVTPATCGTLTTLPDGAVNPPFTLDLPRPQHLTSNHLDLTDHLATLEQEAMARHGKLQAKRYLNTTWCSKDAKDAPCKKQGNPRLPTVEEELSVVSVGLERSSSVLVHRN
ncbi:substance-K receptor-like [Penaeus japonicus]|uniref:substance-K receptor-like n=1 Tax=Penaeus japonicus TaxID=27405 RepID=UPI001C7173BC|nr:substance-K receptor-like [Penaeus japonicus]